MRTKGSLEEVKKKFEHFKVVNLSRRLSALGAEWPASTFVPLITVLFRPRLVFIQPTTVR